MMQIANIKNGINYRFSSSNIQANNNSPCVDEYKKKFLDNYYKEQYNKDLRTYNIASVLGFAFCVLAVLTQFAKGEKSQGIIAGIVLMLCSPLYLVFKPKEEKYLEKSQLDFKKEVKNENSSNK